MRPDEQVVKKRFAFFVETGLTPRERAFYMEYSFSKFRFWCGLILI